ncbi:30S ribosomal protein S17 [Candidatus Daviesbacteria bacterium]|nr:30S ribosomal protein S17 [Candidatus Daviesbacteria bacterium]
MIGRVVSTKMKGAATVLVERVVTHPLYKKTFIRSKKYLVDDVLSTKDGDIVEIVKVKPISKNKHWKITKVIGKDLAEIIESAQKQAAEAAIAEVMPEEKEESRVESKQSLRPDGLQESSKKVNKEVVKVRKEKTSL